MRRSPFEVQSTPLGRYHNSEPESKQIAAALGKPLAISGIHWRRIHRSGNQWNQATRPALDRMLKDAHRHRFDVVLVWSCDRLARSTKHFLQVLDELNDLGVQFLSQRKAIDTDGPLGRAIVATVSAVAELERSLIVERVRAGMRRAKLDGRRIGRTPLDVDRAEIVRDRLAGLSLTKVGEKRKVSRATVCRLVNESRSNQSVSVSDRSLGVCSPTTPTELELPRYAS
jgi:DNA invertase Pin-like site-specific DNA recombinase